MAGDAKVEESAMLKHRLTGEEREVDVVISSQVASHDVVVSVEATARGRPADVTWVEQQVGKHKELPTSKLILVSEAGFSPEARELALAEWAVPIQPEDLTDDDPTFQIVNRLRSIWPKEISLTSSRFRLLVRGDDGHEVPLKTEEADEVFLDDGTAIATVKELVEGSIEAGIGEVLDQPMLAKISEDLDCPFVLAAGAPGAEIEGVRKDLYLRSAPGESGSTLYPITGVQVVGDAAIRVAEVSLEHRRLGDVYFSRGKGRLGDEEALFVLTENASGGQLTIRKGTSL